MLRSIVFHTKTITDPMLYVGKPGEVTFDTDTGIMYRHDGETVGGTQISGGLSPELLGVANGIAQLDSAAHVVAAQMPAPTRTPFSSPASSIISTNSTIDGGFF